MTGNLHALRHTFCSHLAMRGAPVTTIQELAGHAHVATTMRYMHLSTGAAEAAIRLLEQEPAAKSVVRPVEQAGEKEKPPGEPGG